MANVYLISDDYYKEQYPADDALDTELFYSTLLIEQNTTLEDVLGEDLKAWLITNANTELTGDALSLLEKSQYLLVFLVKSSLLNLKRNSATQSADVKDIALESKIQYLKSKLKKFINESTDILTLIGTDDTYNGDQSYDSPIFFWK